MLEQMFVDKSYYNTVLNYPLIHMLNSYTYHVCPMKKKL